jgi:Leucine-rich repeat (LRR) protein
MSHNQFADLLGDLVTFQLHPSTQFVSHITNLSTCQGSSTPTNPSITPAWPKAHSIQTNLPRLQIPDGLLSASSLVTLDMSHNQFADLPGDLIANNPSLTSIDLSYNTLHELSHDLGGCAKLQKLHVEHNLLDAIPGSIGNCQELLEVRCAPPLPAAVSLLAPHSYSPS